ncbi:MAG: RNA-binding protein [Bacillota bacterium]|jgi:RNA recognition motif-containing protein
MTKTLYVGNLPWNTSEEDLAQTFAPHCEVVSCRIITDRETGRSRGFGFVEVNDEEAKKAVDLMDGQLLAGRPLKVNEARPRQNRF